MDPNPPECPTPKRPTRHSTEEILDMINELLPAHMGPVNPPATPATPVPFSPRG